MRRARPSEARSRSPSPPGRGRGAQDDEGRGRKRGRSSSPSPPAPGKERHTWAIAPASDGVDMNDRSERVAAQLERLKKGREERQRATLERRAQGSEGQPMSGEDSDALQAREDAFHLEQARLRAEKRVAEGRGRALDHLFVIAHPNQVKLPSRALVPPPSQLFAPLTDAEKESLSAELRTMEETDLTAASVWRAALALLDPSLPLEGAHAAVLPDIDAVLRGLADKELVKLRDLVQQEARRGDEEYWGSLQRRVRRREAEVLLEDRHLDWIDLHEPVDRAALRDMMRSPWTPPDREQEGGVREEMGRPVRARVRQLSDQVRHPSSSLLLLTLHHRHRHHSRSLRKCGCVRRIEVWMRTRSTSPRSTKALRPSRNSSRTRASRNLSPTTEFAQVLSGITTTELTTTRTTHLPRPLLATTSICSTPTSLTASRLSSASTRQPTPTWW